MPLTSTVSVWIVTPLNTQLSPPVAALPPRARLAGPFVLPRGVVGHAMRRTRARRLAGALAARVRPLAVDYHAAPSSAVRAGLRTLPAHSLTAVVRVTRVARVLTTRRVSPRVVLLLQGVTDVRLAVDHDGSWGLRRVALTEAPASPMCLNLLMRF